MNERELWCQAIEHVSFLVKEANQNNQQIEDQTMDQDIRLNISTINSSNEKKIVSFYNFVIFKSLMV